MLEKNYTDPKANFTEDVIPAGLLNSIFSERLEVKDGAKYLSGVTRTYLENKLLDIFRGSSLRVFNVEVEKRADQIYFRWILRHQDRPPERFFNWQISEQELLAYDVPVTSLLQEKLFEAVQKFYALEEQERADPRVHEL